MKSNFCLKIAQNLSSMQSISAMPQAAGYQGMYQAKPTLHQTNVVKKIKTCSLSTRPYDFGKQKLIISLAKDHAYLSTY